MVDGAWGMGGGCRRLLVCFECSGNLHRRVPGVKGLVGGKSLSMVLSDTDASLFISVFGSGRETALCAVHGVDRLRRFIHYDEHMCSIELCSKFAAGK